MLTFFRYVLRYFISRISPHCNFKTESYVRDTRYYTGDHYTQFISVNTITNKRCMHLTVLHYLYFSEEEKEEKRKKKEDLRESRIITIFAPCVRFFNLISSFILNFNLILTRVHTVARCLSSTEGTRSEIVLKRPLYLRVLAIRFRSTLPLTVRRREKILLLLRRLLPRARMLDRSLSLGRRWHPTCVRRQSIQPVHREVLFHGRDRSGRHGSSRSAGLVFGHYLAHCNGLPEKRSERRVMEIGRLYIVLNKQNIEEDQDAPDSSNIFFWSLTPSR